MKTIKIFAYALAITSGFVFTSCGSDDSGGNDLPPIGGYNSADEVGQANLVAYWSFDGNGKEELSGTNPSTSANVTFSDADAVKGDAASFNLGYLNYPTIASLSNTLGSFTVSTWVKVANNGSNASVFFSLARETDWSGNINFMAETGWQPATSDSLTVKGWINSTSDLGGQDTRNTIKVSAEDAATGHVAFPNKVGGQWAHAVLTYDGTTRMFRVYVNGVKISNPKWEERGAAGQMLTFNNPVHPVIGAFGSTASGSPIDTWDKGLIGKLDEMRVWKVALSQADIGFLYQLESAGR
ncbi:LamG domain-containing protein [Flavobacterium sp. MFBS3-15]|uniref:LamG domain-containing protein n=1 Tax=Flavobacterium sp. MFBS3-15 TaxID=2989816 RepID=UPI002235A35F|nr:LamG domain-containing protein [Flavobacterium sp. MFBS3-15]MCW4467682.1 LamG domain-containing protein [Flavobacterium sp. MFBS3-15]